MKYNVQDKIDKWLAKADDQSMAELLDQFKQELLKYKKKGLLEDWQNAAAEDALKSRLRTLADEPTWKDDDLLEMALVSAVLWNFR